MKESKVLRPLSYMELSTFFDEMSIILKSGISSIEGISIIEEETKDLEGQALLHIIMEETQNTGSLYEGLLASNVFPKYALDMIHIGEISGRLDEVTASLAAYYYHENDLKKAIKSAVTYPLTMIVMMGIIIGVLLAKVMPVFNQVFVQLGSEMSGLSKSLLNFGEVISRYAAGIIIIAVILLLGLFLMTRSQKGQEKLKDFASRFVLTKDLSERIALSRFASGISMALKSGIDTDEGLSLAASLVDHPIISKKIRQCQEDIAEGSDFADAVHKYHIFSGLSERIITIGSKSGVMDEAMEKLSVQYDEETNDQIAHLLGIIEPTLVIVLSIIVGMILLSVMLPLMGIMSSIG